jgi:hypothetical protein
LLLREGGAVLTPLLDASSEEGSEPIELSGTTRGGVVWKGGEGDATGSAEPCSGPGKRCPKRVDWPIDGLRKYETTGFITWVKYHGDIVQPKLSAEVEKYSVPSVVCSAKVK